MIDFRIHTFIAVCKYMNFTRAAEELHITQPAVSQHIHYLEERYQTTLFLHEGKRIVLSPSGKLLLQAATALKNDEQLLITRMQQDTRQELPLNFGVTKTIGEFVIAKSLAKYMKQHPDSKIKMIMENTNELLQELKNGSIQFALVEGYFSPEEYDCMAFSSEEFIAVCSSNHQFKNQSIHLNDSKKAITIQDLQKESLIIREVGSGTRDILEKNLTARNLSLNDFSHISEINSMNAIVQLLLADCGISFLYKAAVAPLLENGQLLEIPLVDFQLKHDFTFIWEKESIFGDSYREIFEELRRGNIDR